MEIELLYQTITMYQTVTLYYYISEHPVYTSDIDFEEENTSGFINPRIAPH